MRDACVSMHMCVYACVFVCVQVQASVCEVECSINMWKLTIKAHFAGQLNLLVVVVVALFIKCFLWLVSVAVTFVFVFVFRYCFCFLSDALLLFPVMAVDSSWPHEWKRSRPDEKTNRRNRGTSQEQRHTLVDFLYNCVRLVVVFYS